MEKKFTTPRLSDENTRLPHTLYSSDVSYYIDFRKREETHLIKQATNEKIILDSARQWNAIAVEQKL